MESELLSKMQYKLFDLAVMCHHTENCHWNQHNNIYVNTNDV
jgi:hypothetical protein